jgi:hypothetical protein
VPCIQNFFSISKSNFDLSDLRCAASAAGFPILFPGNELAEKSLEETKKSFETIQSRLTLVCNLLTARTKKIGPLTSGFRGRENKSWISGEQCDRGSMLWSQFSAKKLAFFSKTNVMIIFFNLALL